MARRDAQREQFWQTTLEDWNRSGQSISAFCRSRRLNLSNFFRWRRLLAAKRPTARRSPPAFVPVRIVAEPMAEVVLPGSVVVRVPLTAEPQMITRLVAAVRAAAC